jgi:hypothetical protein
MPPQIPRPTFAFHEIRYGGIEQVPRSLVHPAAPEIARAIPASHECQCSVPVDGTPFALFADLTSVSNGTAYFFFCSSTRLGGGVVPANKFLFEGVTACELATAPEAWRAIMRCYLKAVAHNPPLVSFSAPGAMPHTVPWLAGFRTPEVNRISKGEKDSLLAAVRSAGVVLLARCEQGVRSSVAAGRDFRLDPEEYPELLDLEE